MSSSLDWVVGGCGPFHRITMDTRLYLAFRLFFFLYTPKVLVFMQINVEAPN